MSIKTLDQLTIEELDRKRRSYLDQVRAILVFNIFYGIVVAYLLFTSEITAVLENVAILTLLLLVIYWRLKMLKKVKSELDKRYS